MAEKSSQPRADISVWIQRLDAVPPAGGRASSPDLLEQLKQTLRRPVNRAVCLETDVDPACDLLRRCAADHTADVDRGVALLREMLGIRLVRVTERTPRRIERAYPHLLPSILIKRLFRRSLRLGRLPTDAGVLVLDSITAAHLGAIADGREPALLPVIIDDRTNGRRLRLSARPDERVGEVLARCDLAPSPARTLRQGPPLAERHLAAETRIGDTELWLHIASIVACATTPASLGCTRSGACVSVCPVQLEPAALLEARQRGDVAMGHRFSVSACVECGLCSAACPSYLPLLPAIRQLKRIAT